jgi:hypothetical protein
MGGNPINPAGGAAAGPCKMTPVSLRAFQIKASDMPVTIKLCENEQGDPAKSTFSTITVRSLSTNPPTVIKGQPTAVTKTTFTLTLPVGLYYVGIVVNPFPGSAMAYVYEDCAGSNQLTDIQLDVGDLSGYFTLRVV